LTAQHAAEQQPDPQGDQGSCHRVIGDHRLSGIDALAALLANPVCRPVGGIPNLLRRPGRTVLQGADDFGQLLLPLLPLFGRPIARYP